MSGKIKLVISDLDVTLLPSKELPLGKELLGLIEDLERAGVLFAVASGRQFQNLYRLFYPVRDKIVFIPENGSWVSYRGICLYESVIPAKRAQAIIADIMSDESKEVLVSGKYTYYMNPRTESFMNRMLRYIKATVTFVDSFNDIPEPVIKISAYYDGDIRERGAGELMGRWSDGLHAVVSAKEWVDFTAGNKGVAARFVMEHFGIAPDETVVFGDDNNDVPLFGVTRNSWCMARSEEVVRAKASHTTTDTINEIRNMILR